MPDPRTQAAVEKLAREMNSWQAIELRIRREFEPLPPQTEDEDVVPTLDRLHFVESSGRTRLETRAQPPDHPQATFVTIEFTRGADVDSIFWIEEGDRSSREAVRIGGVERRGGPFEGVFERPEPICYFYFLNEPLHDALARAEVVGEAKVLGRDCDGFRLIPQLRINADPPHFVYWLDRETGIPLRFDHLAPVEGPSHRPYYTWTAESIDLVSGRRLPLTSSVSIYDWAGTEDAAPRLERRLIVEQVEFNGEHPGSMFHPAPAADAHFVGAAATVATPLPLRASYPSDPQEQVMGFVFGAIGLVVAVELAFYALKSLRSRGGTSRKRPSGDGRTSLD